jgi:hypothetical protein
MYMTEFDATWPGWRLMTEADNVLERIADPLGGLALVETGVDVGGVLQTINRGIDQFVGPIKSEAKIRWTHWKHWNEEGGVIYDPELMTLLGEQVSIIDNALEATAKIKKPILDTFAPNVPRLCTISVPAIEINAERRTQLRPSHTDFDIVTMWLGATKPGFKVFLDTKREWLTIDDMPAGYALIWRGDLACTDDGEQLNPIRHYAQYRSVIRRIVMLAS